MIWKHATKGRSKTQSFGSLSSGESELHAALKSAAGTFGFMSMLKDLNWTMEGKVYGDASAALGIVHRAGLGKIQHIDTSLLWTQQTAAERHLAFTKALGKNNPADLFAKYLDMSTSNAHVKALNCHFASGRAMEATTLHRLRRPWATHIEQPQHQERKWLAIIMNKSNRQHGCNRNMNGIFDGQTRVNSSHRFTTIAIERSKLPRAVAWRIQLHNQYGRGHQSSRLICCERNEISPARRQPDELYHISDWLDDTCNSWLSSFSARSNLVSQRDGRIGIEAKVRRSYSSARKGTITTASNGP